MCALTSIHHPEMASTNFVVGSSPVGLPSVGRASSARGRGGGLRATPGAGLNLRSNVAASARSELQTSSNFKSAAFDDWFKTAFNGDDDAVGGGGRDHHRNSEARTAKRRSLKNVNARTLLAEKQAELAKLTKPKPRSKAILSLKDSLPRFAAEKGAARARKSKQDSERARDASPQDAERKKRQASAARKRAELAAKSKQRKYTGHTNTSDFDSGALLGPVAQDCAGVFCKLGSERDQDVALLLKPMRRRAVIEYKMFLERRSTMTAREVKHQGDFVSVCQKCFDQYRKLEKLKGWDDNVRFPRYPDAWRSISASINHANQFFVLLATARHGRYCADQLTAY